MVFEENNILFLHIITGRRKKDRLLAYLADNGCQLINTTYAFGTITPSHLESLIGVVPEVEKVMISCLIHKKDKEMLFQTLLEDFAFKRPNTGIAYTVPIEEVSF